MKPEKWKTLSNEAKHDYFYLAYLNIMSALQGMEKVSEKKVEEFLNQFFDWKILREKYYDSKGVLTSFWILYPSENEIRMHISVVQKNSKAFANFFTTILGE